MANKMENIRILAEHNKNTGGAYIVVKADTERFGENEVMFQGNTFDQCFDYIKGMLGLEKLRLHSMFLYEGVTDRLGRSFPCYMEVDNW